MSRLRSVPALLLSALVVAGCGLRFWKLGQSGLWFDELWTVVGAGAPTLGAMYREWILGDSHPPGLIVLYRLWFLVVPHTEVWARLPSALAGVATVAYLWWGPRDLMRARERLFAAAFFSLSQVAVLYAVSVKQYSLMMLCAAVATVNTLRIAHQAEAYTRRVVTLSAAALGLMYLNHFAMVYAWMLVAWAWWSTSGASARRLTFAALALALLYLPIAPLLYLQLLYGIDDWQPFDALGFMATVGPSMFYDSVHLGRDVALFGGITAALVAGTTGLRSLVTPRNRRLLTLGSAYLGFMLLLGLGWSKPIFYVRYFLVAWPLLALVFGMLCAQAYTPARPLALLVVVAFFSREAIAQFTFVDRLERQAWRESVDAVLADHRAGDTVYVLGAPPTRTSFEYLRDGDIDGLFYVHNLPFYRYYFDRRGRPDIARQLLSIAPTVEGAEAMVGGLGHGAGRAFVLAGHHINFAPDAIAALYASGQVEITTLPSTLIYRVAPRP